MTNKRCLQRAMDCIYYCELGVYKHRYLLENGGREEWHKMIQV